MDSGDHQSYGAIIGISPTSNGGPGGRRKWNEDATEDGSNKSEPNVWTIMEEGRRDEKEEDFVSNGRVKGLLMTYVDDLFVSAEENVAKAMVHGERPS